MATSPEEIKKATKTYLIVCGILFLGTILTVLVATIPALDIGRHGFDAADCILGLMIASVKATLVAYVFMHLNHEKKAIYWMFGAGFVFVACLFGLTYWSYIDPIFDPLFYK